MQHIISNTGVPSMSRNHARHDSTWVSFDGKSRTCKIGKFTYDWTYDSIASGKSFLGIQSPTPEFAYKDYAAGECEYFGVQFGNAETKSKLVSPEPDLPDPMRFNANWQGVDGSMISWISNENNTGVSSSTFVMVGGQFYDLGKPILGAALNQGFILAIHCEDGAAVFCEYQINNNGSVTKNMEKSLNDAFPIDFEEINRVNNIPFGNKGTVEQGLSSTPIYYTNLSKEAPGGFYMRRTAFLSLRKYRNSLNSNKVFNDNIRCSFSPNLSNLLLHLIGGYKNYDIISGNTNENFNTNGFALFNIKTTSLTKTSFFYEFSLKEKRRFENPCLEAFPNGNAGFYSYKSGSLGGNFIHHDLQIELNANNFFIFAEFSSDSTLTWLDASISINGLIKNEAIDAKLGYQINSFLLTGHLESNLVIRLNKKESSWEIGKDNFNSTLNLHIPFNSDGSVNAGEISPQISSFIIPVIEINYLDLRCNFLGIKILKFDMFNLSKAVDDKQEKTLFIFSKINNKDGIEKQLSITKNLNEIISEKPEINPNLYNPYIALEGKLYSIIKNTHRNDGTLLPKSSVAYSAETGQIVYYIEGGFSNTFNGEEWIEFDFIGNHQIAFYYIDMGS